MLRSIGMLPYDRLPFALLCLVFYGTIQADEMTVSVSAGRVSLGVSISDSGYTHCRVDASENLESWERVSAITLRDGAGAIEFFAESPETLPDTLFFRVMSDDSSNNVLELPVIADDYETVDWPAHLAFETDNTPVGNRVSDEGALLGRVLFYDKKLSANHTVSCASCHQQEHGFSDPSVFSTGFDGELTGRNSMGLTNSQFYDRGHFFWDERADTLEDQVLQPIENAVEMGLTLSEMVDRVDSYAYYEELFVAAFGDSTVTSQRIALALSQFVRSIISYQSKYDIGVATDFANFTDEELQGKALFEGRGRCAGCHAGPNLVGVGIANNGLEYPYVDLGVGGVTGSEQDMGRFKMSSLRNIEKTAPYMHDGRFATLEDVVDHYSTGVVLNPNLGGPLTDGQGTARQPDFSAEQKAALVAFLLTLTDDVVLTDEKLSDPFQDGVQ